MAHVMVAIDAPPEQHKRLVDAINKRKYQFQGGRKGFNSPHVSEVRMYNFRIKKEVIPHYLKDLGVSSYGYVGDPIKLRDVLKKPKADKEGSFAEGRFWVLTKWLMHRFGKIINIHPLPKPSEKKKKPFIPGWFYVYPMGMIKDISRHPGNEEL